jgi:hypothetical protein
MSLRKGFLIPLFLLAAVTLLGGPGVTDASASTIYALNVDYCTTSCLNGGLGGTITLTQNGANNVIVAVALSNVTFHNTNGFESIAFNLTGNPVITVSSITANAGATFALVGGGIPGSLHEDGAGNFEYALDQTGGGEGTTLSFNVNATGLTEASFHELSTGSGHPSYFEVSVRNGQNIDCTGVIGADGGSTPVRITGTDLRPCQGVTTPEPGSAILLGIGLSIVGAFGWRKRIQ